MQNVLQKQKLKKNRCNVQKHVRHCFSFYLPQKLQSLKIASDILFWLKDYYIQGLGLGPILFSLLCNVFPDIIQDEERNRNVRR